MAVQDAVSALGGTPAARDIAGYALPPPKSATVVMWVVIWRCTASTSSRIGGCRRSRVSDHEAVADVELAEISEGAVAAIPLTRTEVGCKTRSARVEHAAGELGEP